MGRTCSSGSVDCVEIAFMESPRFPKFSFSLASFSLLVVLLPISDPNYFYFMVTCRSSYKRAVFFPGFSLFPLSNFLLPHLDMK